MSKAKTIKTPASQTSKWLELEINRIMDMGGDWRINGADKKLRFRRVSNVRDGLKRLDQSNILGLSNMIVHVPFAGFKIGFDMRLVKGQEAKFNLTTAGTDTATRLDFFGAHRLGAVRLSVDDNPFSDAKEFDLSGIDFMKGCRVEIIFRNGRLDLAISSKTKTLEKRYEIGKTFSGVFGFGTYRGRVCFDNISVFVQENDFVALPLKRVYLGCMEESVVDGLCRTVEGFKSFRFAQGNVSAMTAVPVVFSGQYPVDGGVNGPAFADFCVFVADGDEMSPAMAVAAGAALRAGRRSCVIFSGRGASSAAARMRGWGLETYALSAKESIEDVLSGILKTEL